MKQEVMTNVDAMIYKKTKKDPTAWELYQLEHPELNKGQQLKGFVLMAFGVMGLILGGVYTLQHLDQLLLPALCVGGLLMLRKYK